MMYLILIAMTVTSVTADHPILEQAFSDCHRYAKRVPEERQSIARELLEIEIEENLPSGARGLLVAAACHESAFNPRVKCGDEGSSCGIVQQNGVFSKLIRAEIAEAGCVDRAEMRPSKIKKLRALGVPMSIIRRMSKDPRRCWRASARVWVRQLIKQIPKVEASCEGYGGYSTREEFARLRHGREGRQVPPAQEGAEVRDQGQPRHGDRPLEHPAPLAPEHGGRRIGAREWSPRAVTVAGGETTLRPILSG
jgi:hypothetical protein